MHACFGEGNGNPLQCSCLENPRNRGAWWAAVYGVTQSQTRLMRLSSNSSIPWNIKKKNLKGFQDQYRRTRVPNKSLSVGCTLLLEGEFHAAHGDVESLGHNLVDFTNFIDWKCLTKLKRGDRNGNRNLGHPERWLESDRTTQEKKGADCHLSCVTNS